MLKIFISVLLFTLSNIASAQALEPKNLTCRFASGNTQEFFVDEVLYSKTDTTGVSLSLVTSVGKQTLENVECETETKPDHLVSCIADQFSLIIALDENPIQAVINPYVYQRKNYGPYFFVCE